MDGKDGHYYAQFYTAVAVSLRKQWPDVKIGGPVSQFVMHACSRTNHFILYHKRFCGMYQLDLSLQSVYPYSFIALIIM